MEVHQLQLTHPRSHVPSTSPHLHPSLPSHPLPVSPVQLCLDHSSLRWLWNPRRLALHCVPSVAAAQAVLGPPPRSALLPPALGRCVGQWQWQWQWQRHWWRCGCHDATGKKAEHHVRGRRGDAVQGLQQSSLAHVMSCLSHVDGD